MRTTMLLACMICMCLGLKAGHPNQDAQNTDARRWKHGYIVNMNGDTIHGTVKANDFMDAYYDCQRLVSFRDAAGLRQFTPDELHSFSYADGQSTVTYQSVSSPEGDGHVFLRLYYSGACKVYGFTISEIKGANAMPGGDGISRSSLIPTEKKYLQVGGSQFYLFKRVNFKRCMQEAFASCPRILSGLDSRKYTYDNLQALVDDYNKGVK